jgi:fatty acid desaturase
MNPQVASESVNPDDCARDLVRDLHQPNPRIFWTDLLFTASIGWTAFAASLALDWYAAIALLLLAAFALYRGLCFIHELTHLRAKVLPGFETAWNVLFGAPLLLPSFVYVGVHQDHHKLATYGTAQDPEYMPFAKSDWMTIVFLAHSLLIPAFLFLRFVVLAPAALALPPLHRWLAIHASALSMNLGYKRELNDQMLQTMRIWEAYVLVVWGGLLTSMITGLVSWRVLVYWYAVTAFVCVINTLRTLGAHDYASDGAPMDRTNQLLDSIDTPGAFWTELWAPVGLRYHALHHYFPGIPYHNLAAAHHRLAGGLPNNAPYLETISPGLRHSLWRLYRRGRESRVKVFSGGSPLEGVKRVSSGPDCP